MSKYWWIGLIALSLSSFVHGASAQETMPKEERSPASPQVGMERLANGEPATLLTIFFHHDQSKTLSEIQSHLAEKGFWQAFPPSGVEVVRWHVVMGVGQVVTLRVPPAQLRPVNLSVEKHAWGAFKTDFFLTYNLAPLIIDKHPHVIAPVEVQEPTAVLVTLVLEQDSTMTLAEAQAHLESTGFWDAFPPDGVHVVAWHHVMGYGQMITMSVPVDQIRMLNLVLERHTSGAFRTAWYPTYDLWPVVSSQHPEVPVRVPLQP